MARITLWLLSRRRRRSAIREGHGHGDVAGGAGQMMSMTKMLTNEAVFQRTSDATTRMLWYQLGQCHDFESRTTWDWRTLRTSVLQSHTGCTAVMLPVHRRALGCLGSVEGWAQNPTHALMLTSLLTSLLENHLAIDESAEDVVDVGTVISIGDGIARVSGCEACLAGELLEFADGTLGLALNLESHSVGVVRFAKPMGDSSTCVEGSIVRTTRSVANIPVGPGYRGRIVNALGEPMDGLGAIEDEDQERRSLESPAPSIMARRSVHEPFATGITAIDAMIPIGRGQRELIIGDRQTGKTTVAVDAIQNQTDVLCVYVAVGQKSATVAEMLAALGSQKDLSTVVVVLAGADEAATLQFLAPYTGATIAEYFMIQGQAT